MTAGGLGKITDSLAAVIRQLRQEDLYDGKLVERYAEYWVGRQLQARGHEVQFLKERERTSADIYLPNSAIRVEIKSARVNESGFAYASFGLGTQIKKKKFDYCVFLTFANTRTEHPKDVFVFSRDELGEVAHARKSLAGHPDTNPCLLMYGGAFRKYNDQLREWRVKPLKIEMRLHKTPQQFRGKWSKIEEAARRTPSVLHLNLHREFFRAIANRTKRIEYRDQTPFWRKRLEGRHYSAIQFRNGYAAKAPEMLVEFRGLRRYGKGRGAYYAIRLGKILKIKCWQQSM